MAAANGANLFPATLITQVQAPEYFVDNLNQIIQLINAQCAASSSGSLSAPTLSGAMTITDGATASVGSASGFILGGASSKLGFFGATAVAQQVAAASASISLATTAVSTGAIYGFTTAAQGNALVSLANALQLALTNLGLL